MNWAIPEFTACLNAFQFSFTEFTSGLDAKNSDEDSDINSLKPQKFAFLYTYTLSGGL